MKKPEEIRRANTAKLGFKEVPLRTEMDSKSQSIPPLPPGITPPNSQENFSSPTPPVLGGFRPPLSVPTVPISALYPIAMTSEGMYYSAHPLQHPVSAPPSVFPVASPVLVPIFPTSGTLQPDIIYSPPLLQTSASQLHQHSAFVATTNFTDTQNQGKISVEPDSTLPRHENPMPDSYLNGTIELSAGAKPFVPKSFAGFSTTSGLDAQLPSSGLLSSTLNLSPSFLSSQTRETDLFSTLPSALPANTLLSGLNNPFESTSSIGGLSGPGFGSSGLWSHSSGLITSNLGVGLTSPVSSLGISVFFSHSFNSSLDPLLSLSPEKHEINDYLGILQGLNHTDTFQQDQFDLNATRDLLPDLDSLLSSDVPDLH